jgi:integrase
MKAKITKTFVNELRPGPKDFFVWDTELPRFGLKLTPKGRIVYIAQYRAKGRMRRLTIGTHGALSPDQARTQAAIRLREVAEGNDPAEGLAEEKHGATVEDLSKRYLQEHAIEKKKARSAEEDKRLLDKIIKPALGKRTLASVTQTDISKLHHRYRETPYQANRVLALLRKMMNLAEGWGLRPLNSNPCTHIEKFKEERRRRFLNVEELGRLGAALKDSEDEGIDPPHAIAAIRLLLFTGARVSEILTARLEYVNWDVGALVLPDSKTGFKTIPLSAPAREVIENLPVVDDNPFLISGRMKNAHLIGMEHIWYRVRAKAQLPDVRLHDLRHSYASVGAAAGLGLPIIGALLGHMDASTTQRYAHLQQDPLKAAAELISAKIDKAMKRKPQKLRAVK